MLLTISKMNKSLICFNGSFFPSDTPLFDQSNRSFRYGDGLFETILWTDNKLRFWSDHFQRLTQSMNFLGMEIPDKFEALLLDSAKKLVLTNKITDLGRVRISVFRSGAGNYLPQSDAVLWVMSCEKHQAQSGNQGLTIGFFDKIKKPINILSNIKSANGLLYIMAARFAKEQKWDDAIIFNDKGLVCESSTNNIFLVEDQKVITPPLSSGCLDGVFRKNLIAFLKTDQSFNIAEKEIHIDELKTANEIWLTNSISGLRWVKSFENRFYANDLCNRIASLMNV
jgi:branched-chain amino acid aminotransferase